jgi:hypothetical protein
MKYCEKNSDRREKGALKEGQFAFPDVKYWTFNHLNAGKQASVA